MKQWEENRRHIIRLLEGAAAARCGFCDFMEWLDSTDFFRAPASTKHHGSYEGGLAEHSLNVYKRLTARNVIGDMGMKRESTELVVLLHDVCKIDRYLPETGEDGSITGWKYNTDVALPVGHGERSVILIQQQGLTLTLEEITAIRWHMGGFDDSVRGGSRELSEAFRRYPLALQLHIADMEATYLDEKE